MLSKSIALTLGFFGSGFQASRVSRLRRTATASGCGVLNQVRAARALASRSVGIAISQQSTDESPGIRGRWLVVIATAIRMNTLESERQPANHNRSIRGSTSKSGPAPR
jgi:hypothetical protein